MRGGGVLKRWEVEVWDCEKWGIEKFRVYNYIYIYEGILVTIYLTGLGPGSGLVLEKKKNPNPILFFIEPSKIRPIRVGPGQVPVGWAEIAIPTSAPFQDYEPDIYIIRSGVLLSLVSLGRGFGKLRFLKGWLSSCGPQPMVGYLLWIIWCSDTSLWWIGAVCALFCRICGPSSYSLSCSLLFVGVNITSFWDSMGHARFSGELGVLLV